MKAATILLAVMGISWGTSIWLGTVKRGPMERQLRARGTIASRTTVELKIAERDVAQIRRGQPVEIDAPGLGWLSGRVIGRDLAILRGFATVAVELRHFTTVAPGTSVEATIELERLPDVVWVDRPVFAYPNSEVMVFKLDSDRRHATRVRVRFGRASVSTIEVLEGLQVGDVILLSDMTSYEQYERIPLW